MLLPVERPEVESVLRRIANSWGLQHADQEDMLQELRIFYVRNLGYAESERAMWSFCWTKARELLRSQRGNKENVKPFNRPLECRVSLDADFKVWKPTINPWPCRELIDWFTSLAQLLDHRERRVLEMLYLGWTREQIGKHFGHSKEWVINTVLPKIQSAVRHLRWLERIEAL